MAKKNSKIEKIVSDTITKFLKDLGFETSLEIDFESPFFSEKLKATGQEGIGVSIQGENLGILIGFRGETLQSLQLLVNILINKKLSPGPDDSWLYVNLDVGGWKKEKEESLMSLASRNIERVLESGKEIPLPPMNGSERRIVHLFLELDGSVGERSEGFEPNRRIVLFPRP